MTDTCQETANKTNSKPKEDATDVILLDSLKYRKVDATPEKMAKAVNLARNSVRSRLREFEDLFKTDIGVRESGSARKGSYQMYPYEALPILRAYLKAERMSNSVRCDEEKLFSRLISELDCEPEWSFAKEFLYSQKEVRDYVLKEKVEAPIDQRLALIKELSRELPYKSGKTEGYISSYTIGIDTILERLDNLLMILVDSIYASKEGEAQKLDCNRTQERSKNHVPLDESITQKRETLATADYWLKDEAAACWVQAWCQELKERRDSITTDGKIKLSPVEGEPEDSENKTRARLSKKLRETLSEPERRLCNEFCVAIKEVEKRACCVEQILNEDELNRQICDIMDVQIRRHMDAVFSGLPDDECIYDESWGVGSAVGGFIEDWYKMVRYAAASLERYAQLLYWCVFLTEGNIKMLSEQRREDLNRLVLQSCNRIEVFWNEINAMTKMTKERYMADLHEAITKANERLNMPRELKNYLKQMMVKMGTEKKIPSDVTVTLYAGTVTLEFFWRVTAREYADNIIRMIRNLQEVQREQADKSAKNKG